MNPQRSSPARSSPAPSSPARSSSPDLPGGVWVAADAIRLAYSRASGPGGQNVNKVNTKAELWVKLADLRGIAPDALARLAVNAATYLTIDGEIHLTASTERSQAQNRKEIFDKLRNLILLALVRPKRRHKTRPTRASRRRRLDEKRHRGEIKSSRSTTEE